MIEGVALEFLTDEQVAGYGRFEGELTQAELERFFFLDDADREVVAHRRSAHSRLGFAVQLGTVRFLGTFLSPDPLDVPWSVVDYLAGQLDIADPSVVKRYTARPMTAYEHAWEIRRVSYGRMCGEASVIPPDAFIFRDLTLRGFWLVHWFRHTPEQQRRALLNESNA